MWSVSPPEPILKGMTRGQTLQQFIQDTVQPTGDYRRGCDQMVERVTYFLQHHTRFSVAKVVRGGSLGKATNVLDKSDVDLVVFINDVQSVAQLQVNMSLLLDTIKADLESKWTGYAGRLQFVRRTNHGLQFKLSCDSTGHVLDVDILPAFDVLRDRSPAEVFAEMTSKSESERAYYSACFAARQIEFVKEAPIKVKNLIRLVKHWAKMEVNRDEKLVTSYFLELVVISRWQQWGQPHDFNTDEKFEEVMGLLSNLSSLRILWQTRYNAVTYRAIPANPVVLDPANPYINVAPLPKHHATVEAHARTVLRRIQALKEYKARR